MRVLVLTAALLTAGCAPAGVSSRSPEAAPGPAGPVLASTPVTRAAQDSATALYGEALAAFEAGRGAAAEASATRVVEAFPGTPVSVDALWLRARIRATRVESDGSGAGAAAGDLERLLSVLPGGDPRQLPATLTLARVLAASGEPAAGLRRALDLPSGAAVPDDGTVEWARTLANGLGSGVLEDVLDASDPGQPLRVPVLVAYARSLRLDGDDEGARRNAASALEAGAQGFDAQVAQALVEDGHVPRSAGDPVELAVVLPMGGSPAFQVIAQEILEGIEAAVEAWDLAGEVELRVLDDGGDPAMAANLVRSAEAEGAVAVLGLLDDASLTQAARARRSVPLVSPTAYDVPAGDPAPLSLNAFDPGSAEALAEWTATSGIRQVVIIHASSGASAREAEVFSRVFQGLGGSVLRTFPYEAGATFWETQIRGAAQLLPEALVLPVPAEDLPGLAPQVTFFGLDTLGIRILGTGGWTDPRILAQVSPRHTDGVVVASPVRSDPGSAGYTRFREAYERRFRRSLVDGLVPSLGYDAASLVLHGVWAGAATADEVSAALSRVTALEGATGELSVVEGALRRRHEVVCLTGRAGTPLLAGQLPMQLYRPYPPDEETGNIPEGPGRPAGFECPAPLEGGEAPGTLGVPAAPGPGREAPAVVRRPES